MGFRLTGNVMVMESPHTGPSNFRNNDPFITRIHWWPVDSLHTGPAISSILQNDKSHIAVTSHGRHGFSTHWHIYCLFNSSWNPPGTDRNTAHLATPPAITTMRKALINQTTKLHTTGPLLWESTSDKWITNVTRRVANAKIINRHANRWWIKCSHTTADRSNCYMW